MSAQTTRFVVVGDATLDVTVRGSSPPAPGSDLPASISLGPGGQGANMAVRLARGGARVSLLTPMADDMAGAELRSALAAEGVELVPLPAARSGIVVSLVDGEGERAMLSDRVSFDPAALTSSSAQAALADADWIHVSGYPLADPESGEALATVIASRSVGQRCSVAGGSSDEGLRMRSRLQTVRPDLVVFDRGEAAALLFDQSGRPGVESVAAESASALASGLGSALGGVAVVTDGRAGAAAATESGAVTVPGWPGGAVDATGAGDGFAAGVLLTLAGGPWVPPLPAVRDALERASRLGAEVAGVVGAQARVPSET